MKLVIEIEFGNDAMRSYSEAMAVIPQIQSGFASPVPGDGGYLWDLNGNRVGEWKVVNNG